MLLRAPSGKTFVRAAIPHAMPAVLDQEKRYVEVAGHVAAGPVATYSALAYLS